MNRKSRRAQQAKSRSHVSQQILQGLDPIVARDFRDAVEYLQQGKLQHSEDAHRRVLSRSPRHAPTLHHLGLIAFKRNDRSDAVRLIRQSLAIDPGYHQAWLNLAVVLGDLRRSDEAIDAARRSIELQPAEAGAHAVLGNLLRVAQKSAEAVTAYTQSLALNPDQPLLLVKVGELMVEAGNASGALDHCRRALALDPRLESAKSLERRIAAAADPVSAAKALAEDPNETPQQRALRLNDLGLYLRQQSRFEEAVDIQRRAVACDPGNATLHFDLAVALECIGQQAEALASYQAGLAIEPDRAEAYSNVGAMFRTGGMMTGAIQALEHALKLDPNLAVAHYNLAIALKQTNKLDEALSSFKRSVECAPDSVVNRFELNNVRAMLCDWDGLDEQHEVCLELLRLRSTSVAPFQLLSMPATRADQLEAGRRYSRASFVPPDHRFNSHERAPDRDKRIRVGFLSADYFEHATVMLLVEVMESLDRDRFEVFGYCYSPEDGTPLRRRMVGAFDRFTIVKDMTNKEAARTIYADNIDVLIDLKGYTKDARSEILAYRPAPIQVNWLGYPATMGADFIDYIIADDIIAPFAHQPDYSEQIVHLPNCYQPNDRQRKIADLPIARSDVGLPEDAFVFCSFNNSYKITPSVFAVWMRLLKRVEHSVLWLLVPPGTCQDNLRREAEAHGIDPSRLVFAKRMPIEKHLARHKLADLFLDALPCTAHTTASDALWSGLPILTCMGETFAGRVAASVINAAGLPELITTSLEDYEARAFELASNRELLAGLRQRIDDTRETCPLFDSLRFTRNLEKSFETMVDIMRAAEAPRPFSVVENFSSSPEAAHQDVTPIDNPRTLYEACPLCDCQDIPLQVEAKVTQHPLYTPQLPPTMKWRGCNSCGHIFAEGYFTPEACEIIFSSTHDHQRVGNDAENQRRVSARMVERIARYVKAGDWLDIGVGNGSLLFTAAEWGFTPVGTDLRIENVEKLRNLGYEAHAMDIEELDAVERFSVVSMADVLEHVPYPRRALTAVNRMMKPGGVIFVSMPNVDSIVWRALDATRSNPYWGELEHYHNFTRARLVALLEQYGFRFAEYNISERYRSCMEVIAVKA